MKPTIQENLSQINRVNLHLDLCLKLFKAKERLTVILFLDESAHHLAVDISHGAKERSHARINSYKYTMAIHDFQSALKNGYFQLPDVYRLLGLAYIQLNLSTRAIQTYTEGIKCQTIPDVKLLLCRAEAYYYSNEVSY
ncbi:tetratricopeptide repeat 6 [Schistosoma japonicum]|nr:tetratricopeptide repeat 6 [Schistosoma japonicum]